MGETLRKCTCGKKPEMYVGPHGAYYTCKKCGKKATASWDTGKALQHWNDLIQRSVVFYYKENDKGEK